MTKVGLVYCTTRLLSVLSISCLVLLAFPVSAQVAGVPLQSFVRGDYSGDGEVEIGDAIGLLGFLFLPDFAEPSCEDAADVNDDGAVTLGDVVYTLSYLFVADSASPVAPFPSCGLDDTSDGLTCAGAGAFECPWFPPPEPPLPFQFQWPMPGVDTQEWVINNYVDLDPTSGLLDYMGGMKTYNGHRALDIDVPTFRAMDDDYPILAAAPGIVVDTEDSFEDRHTSCGPTTPPWNFVTIEHDNGWKTIYGHLKQNSVVVTNGQTVSAGDVLGVVGSSGCSTAAHLHFEVLDSDGEVVDPFLEGLFVDPPVYDTPIGFMDAVIYRGAISSVDQIKDPPANATIIEPGDTLGVGLSMAGGDLGDSFGYTLRQPSGVAYASGTVNASQVYRHSYWWWNPQVSSSAPIGMWELEIRVNGVISATYPIFVGEILSGFQQVRHGLPASQYQQTFDLLVANGYRPVWVDGYDFVGEPHFNLIFDRSSSSGWSAQHGLSGSAHQSTFDNLTDAGYRLVHVDSYVDGGNVRYATIYEAGSGPTVSAYHGVSVSTHEALFAGLTSQGYRAKNISVVEVGGSLSITALYDTTPVGSWVATAGLTVAGYQAEFDAQTAAGRTLSYLDAYEENGVGKYSAIWDSVNPSSWAASHDLSPSGFQADFDTWMAAGLNTRIVTGHWYQSGAGFFPVPLMRFAGFWSN